MSFISRNCSLSQIPGIKIADMEKKKKKRTPHTANNFISSAAKTYQVYSYGCIECI
jgi:hypothetical protein